MSETLPGVTKKVVSSDSKVLLFQSAIKTFLRIVSNFCLSSIVANLSLNNLQHSYDQGSNTDVADLSSGLVKYLTMPRHHWVKSLRETYKLAIMSLSEISFMASCPLYGSY